MALRETGSILVTAPRDRVFEVLRHRLQEEPGLRTMTADRIESERKTFVLRDAPGGTRVVHARTTRAVVAQNAREDLRLAVSEELLSLQKLVEQR